jgi:hypothetical protein
VVVLQGASFTVMTAGSGLMPAASTLSLSAL